VASRPVSEFRKALTPRQLYAGRNIDWLRSVFAGTKIEDAVAEDPLIAGDPNIVHVGGPNNPDFVIGSGNNVDITGNSASSLRSHMSRPYYDDPSQIITYDSLADEFLEEMFE